MSSSASEYLRRKMQALPRTYGPATYGDASQRTAVVRYRASRKSCTSLTTSTSPSCCTSLNWHSSAVRVPAGGPYNGRNGDGQQQEWSIDGLIASRVSCAPLAGAITVPGCCPPDRPAGIYYDASDIPMTAAYQGARLKCCEFNATLATIKKVQDPSGCSCAVDPNTHLNTLLANNMPRNPDPPYYNTTKPCCVHPAFPTVPCPTNPCCDEDEST